MVYIIKTQFYRRVMNVKKCIDCIWFKDQKETIINYCIMKQSDNKNPEEENNCKYFALRIR